MYVKINIIKNVYGRENINVDKIGTIDWDYGYSGMSLPESIFLLFKKRNILITFYYQNIYTIISEFS